MNEAIAKPPAATAPKEGAKRWQEELRTGRAALRAAFVDRPDTSRLLRGHTRLVDRIIASIWRDLGAPAKSRSSPSAATVAASSSRTPMSTS